MLIELDVRTLIRRMLLAGASLVPACDVCDIPASDCYQVPEIVHVDPADRRLGPLVTSCEHGSGCLELCAALPGRNVSCEVLPVGAGMGPGDGGTSPDGDVSDAGGASRLRSVRVLTLDCPVCGRRPQGWAHAQQDPLPGDLPGWLALSAELEAASVHAFVILSGDLEQHGAPAELVEAARAAAGEEVRHARLTGRLARRLGAQPRRQPRPRFRKRALVDVAIENVVEGCVRETLGAAVAAHQAVAACNPDVRELMASIADDEAGHAVLAFRVRTWADGELTRAGRHQVAAAARRAIETLASADRYVPPTLIRQAGLPSPAVSQHFVAELRAVMVQDAVNLALPSPSPRDLRDGEGTGADGEGGG